MLTHTLHYGTGVFEGIRAYETDRGPAIFRLTDHIVRLFNSARILGPAVGGVLLGWVGEGACFWINALSFLAVIGGLAAG